MISLATTETFRGKAGTAAVITYTISGDEITTVDGFKTLAQGQLGTGVTTLYTVPASTQTLVKEIHLANTSGSNVSGIVFYIGGTAVTNQINSLAIPANGSATYDGKWTVYDASGVMQYVGSTGPAGSQGIQGIQGIQGVAGEVPNARTIATTAPLTGGGDLSANRTLAISAATTSAAGSQSAIDKKKVDNLWYDVTANSIATLVGDDATDNSAAWATLFAGLPVGANVYFPPGTYRVSTELTISADKHLKIKGAGKYASWIKSTSTTAHIFHINGNYWYNTFEDIGFDASVTKTAGSAVHINPGTGVVSAVGTNFNRVAMRAQFIGIHALSINVDGGAANLSIWNELDIATGPVNARGVIIQGGSTNLVISNSTINMGYPPFQVAGTACIEIIQSGAVQMTGNDFIGGTNTLLLNGSGGGSTSVAAVYATNCFFDQSAGSTVKVTGANIVNRIKFVQCGITGGNVAGAVAVEIAQTGTGAAGTATARADGIDFFDCDIYPNGGSGTTSGFLITGAQGVAINACRISGWTQGIAITPSVSAGYTKVFITGNKLGATNNFTTPNGTGLILNAGSFTYGGVIVLGNDFTGSTVPLTDASTTAFNWQKTFDENLGLLSIGAVSLPTAVTAVGASATVLINGTSLSIPTNGLRVGTRIRFNVGIIKTPAGTATWQAHVKFGTANTNADAAIASWTSGTNTAAIDQATLAIDVEILTLGAAATARCFAWYVNTLTNATGLGIIAATPTSTAAFNSAATSPWLHVDIQSGVAAGYTVIGVVDVVG